MARAQRGVEHEASALGNDYWEVPPQWEKRFEANVEGHRTANAAWEKIKAAGIDRGALRLLYNYSGGEDKTALLEWAKRTKTNCKAAIRAADVARKRTNDSRSRLFTKRANRRMHALLTDPWPARDRDVSTLGDVVRRDNLPVEQAGRAAMRTAGKGGVLFNPVYYLFLLRGYAKQHDVVLGLKRMTALAACAEKVLQPETLTRYFRSIKNPEPILRDTLRLLP